MKRIMYIECKANGLDGPGRIGWVEMTRTARSYYYNGKRYSKVGSGYKYDCIEEGTGAEYRISGTKKRGGDKLDGGVVDIDEEARTPRTACVAPCFLRFDTQLLRFPRPSPQWTATRLGIRE